MVARIAAKITEGMNGELAEIRKKVEELRRPQASVEGQTGYDIITNYWRDKYRPVFRRGEDFFSAAQNRVIPRRELVQAAGKELLGMLLQAINHPQLPRDGGPNPEAGPRFFRLWAPEAHSDVLRTLPEEHDVSHDDGSLPMAEAQFRTLISNGLYSQITLATYLKKTGELLPERNSIIYWATHEEYSKLNLWTPVHSYLVWGRQEEDETKRVALRVNLFAQIGMRDLGSMKARYFSQLCERYGIGRSQRLSGGARVVELDRDYLRSLIQPPSDAVTHTPDGAAPESNGHASLDAPGDEGMP